MSLTGAIEFIQTKLSTLDGIRATPALPPESINVFPIIIAFPGNGTWEYGVPGAMNGTLSIVVQLHIARHSLPRDIEKASQYVLSVPMTIMRDPTLGGNIKNFSKITFSLQEMAWNNQDAKSVGLMWTVEGINLTEIITE